MSDLKLVPKPEGFDLRNARADKTNQAKDWQPADAIYWASQKASQVEMTQVMVVWWEKQADGTEKLNFSHSTQSAAERLLLLQSMVHAMLNRQVS